MSRLVRVLAGALVLFAAAGAATAAEVRGPAFGNNKFTTTIQPVGLEPDFDDYVAPLMAGEKLTVTVAAGRSSDLHATLQLLDPAGNPVDVPVVEKKSGRVVSIKSFEVTSTGRWSVRVGSRNQSIGEYTISFKVKSRSPQVFAKQKLGGADPLQRAHAFHGLDGALLDLTLSWNRKLTPVGLDGLTDPTGGNVPGSAGGSASDQEVVKGTKATLDDVLLRSGDGSYTATVGIAAGTAEYTLALAVSPTARPKGKKAVILSSVEPRLDVVAAPIRGVASRVLSLTGSGFAPGAQVLFGTAPGTGVSVAADGRSLQVSPPTAPDGTTVDVAVVNPDGQASVRAAYFFYVPLPTITDLTDLADPTPASVRGGSSTGGQRLRLRGTDFEAGQTVRFGTVAATGLTYTDATTIELTTSPTSGGDVEVLLTDNFGRLVRSSFLFTFKAPPTFAATPYSPAVAAEAGGTVITITGANFQQDDQLLVGGVLRASTFVNGSTRRFTSPAAAPGTLTIALRDRFNTVVDGPDLTVKAPPTPSALSVVSGPSLAGDIPLAGGTILRVSGSGFATGDTVTLGGTAGTIQNLSATTIDFVAPAGSGGLATLVVTDTIAQSGSIVDAIRYIGFGDVTGTRSPGGGATDDLSAIRGALGDLDDDGADDDLVLVSAYSPGSRYEATRIFFESSGALTDGTDSYFPAAYTDPNSKDFWAATAVAIGDVDGGTGDDIVIAGLPVSYYDVRVFTNDGSGSFAFSYDSPTSYYDFFYVTDSSGSSYRLATPNSYPAGNATALAIGDLDGDGDDEIVMGTDHFRAVQAHIRPTYVTFTPGNYYDANAASHYYSRGYYYYSAGTRIFDNDLAGGNGFVDVSFQRFPIIGTYPSFEPGLNSNDMALGDVDADSDLDIVITWNEPRQVSVYGVFYGLGSDTPRTSTRVLENDGNGFFTDATDSWLPTPSTPEFWQGHRMALVDLDADSDLDLVIVHAVSVDAHTGTTTFTRPALRILRNDGTSFTEVTTSALPSVPLTGTQDDNLRGQSLVVRDVNGDGDLDILVGTTEALLASNGSTPIRSTRLLLGATGLTFRLASDFLPATSTDTGEADDLLVGDIAGNPEPSLLLLTETPPATSPSSENLRILDWQR